MTNERRQELIAEWQADLKEEAVRAERATRNEQLLGEIRDLLHDNDSRGETTLTAIRDLIIERNALRSDKQNLREIITRSRDAQQAAEQRLADISCLFKDYDVPNNPVDAVRTILADHKRLHTAIKAPSQHAVNHALKLRGELTAARDAQQKAERDLKEAHDARLRLGQYASGKIELIADLALLLNQPVSNIKSAVSALVSERREDEAKVRDLSQKVDALQKDLQEKIDALRAARDAQQALYDARLLHHQERMKTAPLELELQRALRGTGVDLGNQPLLAAAALVAERFAKERPLLDALRAAINKAAPTGQPEAHYLTIATGLLEAIPCYRDRLIKADVRLREFEAKDARNTAEDPQPGDEVAGRLVTGRTPDRVFWKVLYSSRTYQCDIISWRKWVGC